MARTPRSAHVGRETMLEHAEGRPLAAAANAHLDGCASCRQAMAETERLLADLRAPALATPPDASVTAALRLFPARPPLAERILESLGRLVRIERPMLAAAGVRGGGASATAPVRLLLAADQADVDLELSKSGRKLRVTGQALAPDGLPAEGLAWAERGAYRGAETPIGASGIFHLEDIPGTPFDLVLDLGSARVRFRVEAAS